MVAGGLGPARDRTRDAWTKALGVVQVQVRPAMRRMVATALYHSLLAGRAASPDGILPVWQFHGRETWRMIGYHAVPVIADAYLKGIRGFDANAVLDVMVASASYAPYGGPGEYMRRGYVPIDREPEAASPICTATPASPGGRRSG